MVEPQALTDRAAYSPHWDTTLTQHMAKRASIAGMTVRAPGASKVELVIGLGLRCNPHPAGPLLVTTEKKCMQIRFHPFGCFSLFTHDGLFCQGGATDSRVKACTCACKGSGP